ncbi:MAG: hypothetical protein J6P84_05375 [Alphaproteobacteria bacterium]|nr:hypothetical protein [Alphaproteobacteria bacterium]
MSGNEVINKNENQEVNRKLRKYFDGRIVRKDLTKKIKEGANVPVYVLEYLLGQYCNSENEEIIEEGVNKVKRILADNYVRPDESPKILARLTDRGLYTIIDKVIVKVNLKENQQEAEFSNLGIKKVPIHPDYSKQYDRLLCGEIWCIIQLEHNFVEEDKNGKSNRFSSKGTG